MRVVIIVLLVATVAPAFGADIYQCVDANGNLRFTNQTSSDECKRLNLSSTPAATKIQPTGPIPVEPLNAATYALVDPDESVRERAQQDLEKELASSHRP